MSEEENLNRILADTYVDVNQEPSIILARLRDALGSSSEPNTSKILRQMLVKMLPTRTREFSSVYQDNPLDKQANVTDRPFDAYEKPSGTSLSGPVTSVNSVGPTQSLQNLTMQVAEICSDHERGCSRNSSPGRSCVGSQSDRRSRTNSPYPRRYIDWYDGKCWYHAKFGDGARKCVPGYSLHQQFMSSSSSSTASGHEVRGADAASTPLPESSMRLFVFDVLSRLWFLVDSGSMVSVLPMNFFVIHLHKAFKTSLLLIVLK